MLITNWLLLGGSIVPSIDVNHLSCVNIILLLHRNPCFTRHIMNQQQSNCYCSHQYRSRAIVMWKQQLNPSPTQYMHGLKEPSCTQMTKRHHR